MSTRKVRSKTLLCRCLVRRRDFAAVDRQFFLTSEGRPSASGLSLLLGTKQFGDTHMHVQIRNTDDLPQCRICCEETMLLIPKLVCGCGMACLLILAAATDVVTVILLVPSLVL